MTKEENVMNKKLKENYEQLAQSAGIRLDEQSAVLYGSRGGYDLIIYTANANYPYQFTVITSASRTGGPISKKEAKQFTKSCKPALSLSQSGYAISMQLRAINNQKKLLEALISALDSLTGFLRTNGFVSCCQSCGQPIETDSYCISGGYMHLCPDCFSAVNQKASLSAQQKAQKKENLVGGIVGALLGTLLGAASIIVFSQLGYVAALSGVIMAVCTLKGYELLGGKLSKPGIVISILLMVLMTYVGDRIDWAILVARELETDFATSYQLIPILLSENVLDSGSYWGNLALVYIFMLGGAIPTIINSVKSRSNEGRISRIGAS